MIQGTDLRGVYAVLPTPANEDAADPAAVNTVNLAETARLVENLVRDGVAGMIVTGTTGEAATLTPDEFKDFVHCVMSVARGRVSVFVGTTALGTHEIIARSKFARSLGAAGIMLGLPMWQPMTTEMAVKFYASMSATLPDLPIIAYANPRAFRHDFGDDLWAGIAAQAPTVIAAKFSDPRALRSAVQASGGRINFMPHDGRALEFHTLEPEQFSACWSTSSSMGPSPAVAVTDAVLRGDLTRAKTIADDIHWTAETVLPILRNHELFAIYNIQIEKIRFTAAGYCRPGPIRPPYDVVPAEIEAAAHECGRRWASLIAEKYPLASRHQ